MAVHSSGLECGKRCVHVGYGEAHVCNPDFPPKGNVLSQPRGVRRDTSGNVINKFCTSALHMKLGGPKFSNLSCRTASWNSRGWSWILATVVAVI